jgi:TonB family protein
MRAFLTVFFIVVVLAAGGAAGLYFFKPDLFNSILAQIMPKGGATPAAPAASVAEAMTKAKEASGRSDFAEAIKWYRVAADQGDARAQLNLGVIHDKGKGVTRDAAEAAKWYRKAADQKNADAAYNLAVLYDDGDGVKQDGIEAAKLYVVAAQGALAEARAEPDAERVEGSAVADIDFIFECPATLSEQEKAICAGEDVSKAETEVAATYFMQRNRSRDPERLLNAFEEWFKTAAGACTDASCMTKAYTEKKDEYSKALQRPSLGRHFVMPDYPPLSTRAREQGDTTITACISATGVASDAHVEKSSGFPRLDEAAMAAMPNLRFEPARNGDGVPIDFCSPPYRFTMAWQLN